MAKHWKWLHPSGFWITEITSSPITRIERAVQQLFLLALFCVPFATALTNFFVGLTVIGFVAALPGSPALRHALRSPPGLLALALLGLFIAGASWSIAPAADQLVALKKYMRLLLLPIAIAMSLRIPGLPRRALRWTLAGSAVLATASYLVWLGYMPTSSLGWWQIGHGDDAFAFKNHITMGILLGFAAMACLLYATWVPSMRARLPALGAAAYFAVPIIFLNQGRTGYVTLFVGLAVLYLLRVRVTALRTLGVLAGLAVLFGGFYATSDNFKSRMDALVVEVRADEPRTPNGQRISYMGFGADIVADHPLNGIGTGGFAEAYAPVARAIWPPDAPMASERHQPHSEFLLVAVQLGLPGLLVYFAMLGALARPALAARTLDTDMLAMLWAVYVFASSFNSLLWDTTEAHWFLLLAGCLYVASLRAAPARGAASISS